MRPVMSWMFALTALAVLSVGSGCRKEAAKVARADEPAKKTEPPKADPKTGVQKKPDEAKIKFQKEKDGIGRRFEVEDVRFVMANIKTAHAAVFAEKNRGPTMEELFVACENNPKIVNMVKEGHIEMVWKSLRPENPSKTALAYEFAPDNKGLRMVMTADYDIGLMQENEFQKLEKAPARK